MDDATRSAAPELVEAAGTSSPPDLEDLFVDEPEHYAVAGSIGAGGMGTVLAAKGSRLGRPVAIKVVTADREDLLRRFEREAQVTARLQHPAIVPVYGSGRGKNGRPFYAMKQVTGEALDQVIAKATTLSDRIALVPNVIAVVEAIAYAHGERVIHRDLKPANILVGGFGETVVIDWGLAKDLRTDADDPDTVSPYRTPGGGDETAVGRVMGTPAYMPREQARGEKLDERADVYALGAILYHVLAGASPYTREGETSVPWETKLARVLAGPPPALDQLQPGLPPDLVAIIAKAMARAPEDRYPTANELARDLRRFQTGQLVGAHRYSTWQLVRRWLRRHRTAVTVATVAVALLVAGGIVSVSSIVREQQRTEEQRVVAVKGRKSAQKLTTFMLVDLRDRLKPIGRLDLLDEVVKRAQAYYDALEPAVERDDIGDRALLSLDLGDVLRARGNRDGALARFRDALTSYQLLVYFDPTDERAWRELGVVETRLCEFLTDVNDADPAQAYCKHARDIAVKLVAAKPNDLERIQDLAISDFDLAHAYEANNPKRSIDAYRAAIAGFEKVAALEPDNLEHMTAVAEGHGLLANVLTESRDLDGAATEYRKAKEMLTMLHAKAPKNADTTYTLATTGTTLADMLLLANDPRAAVVEAQASAELFAQLVHGDPANNDMRWARARGLSTLAKAQHATGDRTAAVASFRAEVAVADEIVTASPDNLRYIDISAEARRSLAGELAALGDADGAIAHYRDALERKARMAGKLKDDHWRLEAVYGMSERLGDLLLARHDAAGALAAYRAAETACQALLALTPDQFFRKQELAGARVMVGNALAASTDRTGAKAAYEAALAIAEPLGKESPDDKEVHAILVDARAGLDKVR